MRYLKFHHFDVWRWQCWQGSTPVSVQTEIRHFGWIAITFCTGLHGSQTKLSSWQSPYFSSSATMRWAFVVSSKMSQQLLDGLPCCPLKMHCNNLGDHWTLHLGPSSLGQNPYLSKVWWLNVCRTDFTIVLSSTLCLVLIITITLKTIIMIIIFVQHIHARNAAQSASQQIHDRQLSIKKDIEWRYEQG